MSFWLRFVTKRDFDCEQVKQQTSQPELKHVSVVRLSKITRIIFRQISPYNCARYNKTGPSQFQSTFQERQNKYTR